MKEFLLETDENLKFFDIMVDEKTGEFLLKAKDGTIIDTDYKTLQEVIDRLRYEN